MCRNFFDGVLKAIGRLLEPILDLWQVLKLCRFAVLSIVVTGFFLIVTPQGQEVLIHLETLQAGWVSKNLIFLMSVLVWAWTVWYSSRVILSFRFPNWPPAGSEHNQERLTRIWAYHRGLPRVLGVVAILTISFAFYESLNGRRAIGQVIGNGTTYLATAAGFGLFTWKRLSWAAHLRRQYPRLSQFMPRPMPSGTDPRWGALSSDPSELHMTTRKVVRWSLLLFLIPFLVFQSHFTNLLVAPMVGAASIVLLAAGSWVPWGTLLVYLANLHRIPILTLLIIYASLISTCNDNHQVRIIPGIFGAQLKYSVQDYFSSWVHQRVSDPARAPGPIPLILVSAEGGGIRAAYWTASVLTRIQKDHSEFGRHVFVISGVSGGSLGAAVFASLIADQDEVGLCRAPNEFLECARAMLKNDYLSPTLGTMLYPDLLQRLLFWPIEYWDRGRLLEMGWERAWQELTHAEINTFAMPFEDLWVGSRGNNVPNLILNMTSVEDGKRVLITNLPMWQLEKAECTETWIGRTMGIFDDAIDYLQAANTRECNAPAHPTRPPTTVRLSTAINNSARFSFISPAGTVNDRLHIVDGGYFENSGTTSLEEVYLAIKPMIDSWNAVHTDSEIVPIVLHVSNEPEWSFIGALYKGPLNTQEPLLSPDCIRVEIEETAVRPRFWLEGRCSHPAPLSPDEIALKADKKARDKLQIGFHYMLKLDRTNRVVDVMDIRPTYLDEILTPIKTLFQTRTARGRFAVMHLQHQIPKHDGRANYIEFALGGSSANLPVSWTLSPESSREMDVQLETQFARNCVSTPSQTLLRYLETCWLR